MFLLVQRFGELMRKLWNPRNFKAHVSPHEMLQAVVLCSKKNFQITKQGELWEELLIRGGREMMLEATGLDLSAVSPEMGQIVFSISRNNRQCTKSELWGPVLFLSFHSGQAL